MSKSSDSMDEDNSLEDGRATRQKESEGRVNLWSRASQLAWAPHLQAVMRQRNSLQSNWALGFSSLHSLPHNYYPSLVGTPQLLFAEVVFC